MPVKPLGIVELVASVTLDGPPPVELGFGVGVRPDEEGGMSPENATRARILAAAATVIDEHGLAHTTTKQIARAAGYSEATLYKHFRDKEELCLAVMAERLRPFVDVVKRLPGEAGTRTVRAHLEELAREALAVYQDSGRLGMALFAEPLLLERQRRIMLAARGGPQKANDLLAEYLRREQKRGRVARGVDPAAIADLVLGACFQRAFLVGFMGAEPLGHDEARYARAIVRPILRAITPRSS